MVIYAKFLGINKVVWRVILSYGACVPPLRKLHDQSPTFDMLWFNFMLGLNFILFCVKHIIIHYHTQKQKKIKFKPRIELNHDRYIKILTGRRVFNCKFFKIPLSRNSQKRSWTQRNPDHIWKNDPTASESC